MISIIVPVFNVESYLEKCVQSICHQTYQNIEIILVDDGSTDSSGTLCDSLSNADSRIKVIHCTNQGPAKARNTGLKQARGEWIGFVDSDDQISPDMYKTMLEAAVKYDADLVICGMETIDDQSNVIRKMIPDEEAVMSSAQAETYLLSDQDVLFISPCVRLYARKLCPATMFPAGKRYEDEYIAHELLLKCNRIVTLPTALYYYFQRDTSGTHEQYGLARFDQIEAYFYRYIFLKQNGFPNLAEKSCERFSDFYIESKKQFRPKNKTEKERVQKIDQLAEMIIHEEWGKLPVKVAVRLFAPSVYALISTGKRKYLKKHFQM